MKKQLILLTLFSLILAGCTLQDITSKVGPQTKPPTTVGSPKPQATVEPAQETQAVKLVIETPQDGATVNSPSITVKGVTVAKADVSVNETETKADAAGKFSVPITLEEGENTIVITANDQEGNWAEKELTVTYELPEE